MEKPTKAFVENRMYMLQSMQFVLGKLDASETFNKSHLEQLHTIYKLIKQNKNKQFLCLDINSADYAISYAKDITAPFESKRRVITTLGRYVRRQLNIGVDLLPDVALDEFTNKANAFIKLEKDRDAFKILSGYDIRDYYRDVTGFSSCMEGSNYYRVEIYAMNPEKCSLLVYKKEGRALLWTCDDGNKYIDRLYGNNKVTALLQLWAKDNGYNSCYRTGKDLKVTLKYRTYLPSIDTFQNIVWDHPNKTMICYSNSNQGTNIYGLNQFTIPGVVAVTCKCGKNLPDEDIYKTKKGIPICETCRTSLKICPVCNEEIVSLCSIGVCMSCEIKVSKKCANKDCGKKGNKLKMIKMKRPEAKKVCFVCSETCMIKVNPDWVVQEEKVV